MENIFNLLISIIIISSSILNVGQDNNSIKICNSIISEDYMIVEQGIQGKYLSENSIEDEIRILKNIFEIEEDIEKKNNCFSFYKKKGAIELNIFAIEEKNGVNVEVVIKSLEKDNFIYDLYDIFKSINKDIRISTYLKSKINNDFDIYENVEFLEDSIKNLNAKSLERLPIDLGFTGIAKLKNGEQLNYAVVSYDQENTYAIIGTPVIFITY